MKLKSKWLNLEISDWWKWINEVYEPQKQLKQIKIKIYRIFSPIKLLKKKTIFKSIIAINKIYGPKSEANHSPLTKHYSHQWILFGFRKNRQSWVEFRVFFLGLVVPANFSENSQQILQTCKIFPIWDEGNILRVFDVYCEFSEKIYRWVFGITLFWYKGEWGKTSRIQWWVRITRVSYYEYTILIQLHEFYQLTDVDVRQFI